MNALIAFFKSILEISLFASAMIVIVLLLKKIAKDRVSIKVVSFLWLLVIARLCLPGMLESPVHVDDLFPALAEVQQATEQPASQNEGNYFYQNNTVGNPLAENKAATLGKAVNQNQTATAEPRAVTFYEQALTFIKSLDLWLVAAIVWLIGVATVLGSVLKESIAFGLRIQRSSRPVADSEILGIIVVHKRANHLRRNIRVSVCSTIQMPLAFGVLRPHILLPSRMTEELSQEHLEAILLHEVCHIKRDDILKNYACLLVKALHWFNPLVWLSMKKIKTDIELACDQRVLSLLKAGQEVKYCESLLVATRFMNQRKVPQLATSLCENRSNLKDRIVKMIKPQKKSRSAVAISMALALIMFTACFTTACQPTPENPIVIGKQDSIENKITDNTQGDVIGSIPGSVADRYTKGKITVNIDAQVKTPSVSKIPAVNVVPTTFTQETVDKAIATLMQGQPIYEPSEIQTKSEIESQLVYIKAMQVDNQEAMDSKIESEIERLEAALLAAPETETRIPSDGKLVDVNIDDIQMDGKTKVGFHGKELTVEANLGQDYDARLYVSSSSTGKTANIWFTHGDNFRIYNVYESQPVGTAKGMSMSLEDAQALAETTAQAMGCDLKMAAVRIAPKQGHLVDKTILRKPMHFISHAKSTGFK